MFSHIIQRRSECVDMGSMFGFDVSYQEGQDKLVIKLQKYAFYGSHPSNCLERPMKT